MKKVITILLSGILTLANCNATTVGVNANNESAISSEASTVYYIKNITPENLVKIYNALGHKAHGRVGVKISSGESDKTNHLDTALINPLVKAVNGRFIECNTAYNGNRMDSKKHYETAVKHGYTGIDIMDSIATAELPVENGFHLNKDIVGKNFLNYDFIVVLSHFKGHQMGGFGGALKNISIGIASSEGKAYIHSAGATTDVKDRKVFATDQDAFLESMADACKAITNHCGKNIIYINVANNLSVDCDCNANPEPAKMADFGILASTDPVALDRACVDMVYSSPDHGKIHMIERIESRHGTLILDASEKHGIGTQNYRLVTIE